MPRLVSVTGKISQFANFKDLLHPFLLTFGCIQMDFQDDLLYSLKPQEQRGVVHFVQIS